MLPTTARLSSSLESIIGHQGLGGKHQAAMLAALDKAVFTTLVGSMMPALNMSTYSPLLAS